MAESFLEIDFKPGETVAEATKRHNLPSWFLTNVRGMDENYRPYDAGDEPLRYSSKDFVDPRQYGQAEYLELLRAKKPVQEGQFVPDPNNPGQNIWQASGSDVGTAPTSTPTTISSSTPYRSYLSSLGEQLEKLRTRQSLALEEKLKGQISGIESEYGQRKTKLGDEQTKEVGQLSTGLARIGGYLGGSASEMGVLGNQRRLHQEQMSALDSEKTRMIQQAQVAYEDKQFQLAESLIADAKALEQEAYQRERDFRADERLAQKEEADKIKEESRASRDAIKFALDNKISKPYYTLDGQTVWDTATGQIVDGNVDASQIQQVTPASEVEFETRTVGKDIIRFGFGADGSIVSRTVLGKAGSSGGGGGTSRDDFGLTKAQRVTADGWVEKVKAEATTLDKVPATYYEYVVSQLEGEEGVVDEEQAIADRYAELANSDDEINQIAVQLYEAKYGIGTSIDYEFAYKEALRKLAQGKGTGKEWRSRINKLIEYIEKG